LTDVADKLVRNFSTSLIEHAGPGLPNAFEEAFVWHLAWKKSLTDAYVAAGYLGSGDVAKKAGDLLRKPNVAARSLVAAKAMTETLGEFSSTFQYWNVQPPGALDDIPTLYGAAR
jgi:hypothetical protein